MTLPTGKPNVKRQRQRAFTLVELMLVMTLLIIVISVAAPTLANFFRGRTLDSEARRLLALTRHGQNRAVGEGFPMVLWLDAKARTYGLEAEPGYQDQDSRAVEFKLDKDLQMEVVNLDLSQAVPTNPSPLSTVNPLNATTGSAGPRAGNRRNVPQSRFLPDGSIDDFSPQVVCLTGPDGAALCLAQSRNRLYYEIQRSSNQLASARP